MKTLPEDNPKPTNNLINVDQSPPIFNKVPEKYQPKPTYQDSLDLFQKQYSINPPLSSPQNTDPIVKNDPVPQNNNNEANFINNKSALIENNEPRNSKSIKRQNNINSYSLDIVGGALRNFGSEEQKYQQKFGRGNGIRFMYENPEYILQTQSMVGPKTSKNEGEADKPNKNVGSEYYFRLKEMLSKKSSGNAQEGKVNGVPNSYNKEM